MTEPAQPPYVETYRGPSSFQDRDDHRALFCGRRDEQTALFDMVLGESISVLYSRSGLGKTSLINAGLLHQLRGAGLLPVVARFSTMTDPSRVVINSIRWTAMRGDVKVETRQDVEAPERPLWEFLVNSRFTRGGETVRLAIVLDQFEELFTRVRERDHESRTRWESSFVADLSDVVRRRVPDQVRKDALAELETQSAVGRPLTEAEQERRRHLLRLLYETPSPDVRVLLSMREDYLFELEQLRVCIPTIFQKMFRLGELSENNARMAISVPPTKELPGKDVFRVEKEAENQIVDFLLGRTDPTSAPTDAIDPIPLQIILRSLDDRRRTKKTGSDVITARDVGGPKGMEKIRRHFYANILDRIPPVRLGWNGRRWRPSTSNFILFNAPRRAALIFVEYGLIHAGRRRNIQAEEVILQRYGVPEEDLKTLVDANLVRYVSRNDQEFYELSHDTMISSIREYARRRKRKQTSALLVIGAIAAAVGGFFAADIQTAVNKYRRTTRTESFMRDFAAKRTDFHDRNLSWVRLNSITLKDTNLAGANLDFSSLQDAVVEDSSFRGASLNDVSVTGTRFVNADLKDAKLEGSTMNSTVIQESDLTGVVADGANFWRSEILYSNLSGASLRDVVFEGCDIYEANFAGADIEGATFDGTPWWGGRGWSEAQRSTLLRRFPPRNITQSPHYRHALDRRTVPHPNTASPDDIAYALNNRSWFRAMRGVELDLALRDATDAMNVAGRPPSLDSSTLDTRGYIYLQLGDVPRAIADLEEAVRKIPSDPGNPANDSIIYHLALAYERAGDRRAADYFRRAAAAKYEPTYETVLTPRAARPPPTGATR